MVKIISYNLNGIRAALKKNLINWIEDVNPDILCFQEIKAMKDQIPTEGFEKLGYNHYWYSAKKKGYSGVAILTKRKPKNITYGTGINHIDEEGRVIRTDYNKFSVISLYLPSGTNIQRLSHKFKFMDDFQNYIIELKKNLNNIIICGDYNICHKHIDIHDPIRNKNVSGFLPEERLWLDNFINNGFIDSFRKFCNERDKYTWWSYRANSRANNKGWRIDYILVSNSLDDKLINANIFSDTYQSDHCPIGIDLNLHWD